MRDEVAEQFRISHNEELCDFHRAISILGTEVAQSVQPLSYTDWTTEVRCPAGARKGYFCLRHRVQTGCGSHQPSI
jgi:hypothetical protein